MDDKTQKERLEQELRFLKESFEAEVISKDEFEKGKDRIEKKMKEIEKTSKQSTQQTDEAKKEETKAEPIQETQKKLETKNDAVIKSKENGKIKLKVIQDEAEHEHFEPVQIEAAAAEKIEEPTPQPIKEIKEEKKDNKFFKYAVVFVILILIAFFSYSFLKGSLIKPQEKAIQAKSVAEPKEMPINIIVLNDRKNCFNCDTQRVLSILKGWFGALNIKEIDYNTNEGKSIAEKFKPNLLPLYILDENITKKQSFNQFKQVFVKKETNYVLNENTAGSPFYFKRENIQNKLDLFVISNDEAGIKAEKNLKEFLDTFKEVKFEKHLSNDKLTQELSIKTFPTFLVNNQVKFSGVHTSETIKNNFCKLNKLLECEKSLSKSLV